MNTTAVGADRASLTILDIAREYLPDLPEEELECIIWEETGYPCFFDGEPIDAFRLQLAKVVCREYQGEYGYFNSDKYLRLAKEAGLL